MVSHAQIIARAGKDADVASALKVKPHRVRDWRLRNSIPGDHWKALAETGLATLDELAEAAANRAGEAA